MKSTRSPNMAVAWKDLKFNEIEWAFTLFKKLNPQYENVELNTFGLVPLELVHATVSKVAESTKNRKLASIASRLKSKLPPTLKSLTVVNLLQLDAAKVGKHFGSHPERGKPMTWLPKMRVTVGKVWSLGHKDYIDDENVLVSPAVALYHMADGVYQVHCPPQYSNQTMRWLLDNCA